MKVEIRLFATLAAFLPPEARTAGSTVLEVPDGSTVADAALMLGIPPSVVRVTLVNGNETDSARRLAADDVITIFPPLAGGDHHVRTGRARAAS